MKKGILAFLILFLAVIFLATIAEAQGTLCRSSGLKSSDAVIITGIKNLCGVLIITNGSNDASIILYDNASAASGTILFKGTVAAAANFGGATFEIPVRTRQGIYADVSGTGANYIVYYQE